MTKKQKKKITVCRENIVKSGEVCRSQEKFANHLYIIGRYFYLDDICRIC